MVKNYIDVCDKNAIIYVFPDLFTNYSRSLLRNPSLRITNYNFLFLLFSVSNLGDEEARKCRRSDQYDRSISPFSPDYHTSVH